MACFSSFEGGEVFSPAEDKVIITGYCFESCFQDIINRPAFKEKVEGSFIILIGRPSQLTETTIRAMSLNKVSNSIVET